MKIAYVSLGCPKNVSDLELILGGLQNQVEIVDSPDSADITLINTCSFIESAKTEAIDTILEAVQLKETRPGHKVVVTGCLPQRYQNELVKEMPEVDLFIPFQDVGQITKSLAAFIDKKYQPTPARMRITPSHYGYLKISEGCNNRCSYCAIPSIKGNYRSFAMDRILEDARILADSGVRELIVVAQDTTVYGHDLGKDSSIVALLRELCAFDEFRWVRLMYTHPAHWSDQLINAIAGLDKVVKYIDLPLQHISDRLLKLMRRRVTRAEIERLLEKLRDRIPNLALRTSLIVGFPGETEGEFNELEGFVEKTRFDRLGVFTYSQEEGTRAARFADDVPETVKEERRSRIMELQADIALEKNEQLIGREIDVLIDECDDENNLAYGRSQWDAPEVDNNVIVEESLSVGRFYSVSIDSVSNYDLIGHVTEIP